MTGTQDSGVVLVVDDEEQIREFARVALEFYGYRVFLADGGLSAIEMLYAHPGKIDVVILDMMMPNLTGEMVLPDLIRLRPDLKVIISSGFCDFENVKRSFGHLISSFLRKPYTPELMAEHVRFALLDRAEGRRKVPERQSGSRSDGERRPSGIAARSAVMTAPSMAATPKTFSNA